jgi:hypothetical protein
MDADKIRKKCRKLIDKHAPDCMTESERVAATSIAEILFSQTDVRTSDDAAIVACVEVSMAALRNLGVVEKQMSR